MWRGTELFCWNRTHQIFTSSHWTKNSRTESCGEVVLGVVAVSTHKTGGKWLMAINAFKLALASP
jgi:hypothetical protein